ncbi:MAG: hypothetical protein KBT46_04485, partial [Ruminococcus sp.]|nr:hypothetical protein [Candidatus Copronaster equi]
MVKDCFYYSTITPNGHHSLISKQNFCGCEKILLHGESDAVKQKLFDCVKSEYCCTDLLRDDCKAGVYCKNKNFVVADSNYSAFNSYRKFNLSDYQNKEILNKYSKEINCILSEKQISFERCERFLKACKSISDDALRIDSQSVDRIK